MSAGPQGFVQEERSAFHDAGKCQLPGHIHAPEDTGDEWEAGGTSVGPYYDVEEFDISCDDCCQSGACDTESGGTEFAENEDVVADKIGSNCDGGRDHGRDGLAVRPDRRGVGLSDCKWQKAHAHDPQIQKGRLHRLGDGATASVFVEIEADEEFAAREKENESGGDEQGREDELQAECSPGAFVVPLAAVLGGEDSDAGETSEYAQVPHEKK